MPHNTQTAQAETTTEAFSPALRTIRHMAQTPTENAAKTLGVPPDATANTIKKAWRKAAKTHHPDLHTGQPDAHWHRQQYETAQHAYQTLTAPGTKPDAPPSRASKPDNTKNTETTGAGTKTPHNNTTVQQTGALLVNWAILEATGRLYPAVTTTWAQTTIDDTHKAAKTATNSRPLEKETPLEYAARILDHIAGVADRAGIEELASCASKQLRRLQQPAQTPRN